MIECSGASGSHDGVETGASVELVYFSVLEIFVSMTQLGLTMWL